MPFSVGFIGVGNMGNPMASNVLKAGFPMVVYDKSAKACRPWRSLPSTNCSLIAQYSAWRFPNATWIWDRAFQRCIRL